LPEEANVAQGICFGDLLWGLALGRQMLLWGGKCCSGEANVALGRKVALGRQMLLWGGKLLWGVNLLWGLALGRQMLLWGGNFALGS